MSIDFATFFLMQSFLIFDKKPARGNLSREKAQGWIGYGPRVTRDGKPFFGDEAAFAGAFLPGDGCGELRPRSAVQVDDRSCVAFARLRRVMHVTFTWIRLLRASGIETLINYTGFGSVTWCGRDPRGTRVCTAKRA